MVGDEIGHVGRGQTIQKLYFKKAVGSHLTGLIREVS